MIEKVAMLGVGKLGLPCAEVMANMYDVIGYDLAKVEPSNFKMADTVANAIEGRDAIFIAAPTPHEDSVYEGAVPNSHLEPQDFNYNVVIEMIKEIEETSTENQMIVLISTVSPGTIRNVLQPLTKCPIVYNPYLIAQGTVAKDMVTPEMLIVGSETGDDEVMTDLVTFYAPLLHVIPHYAFGTWEECECLKVFYNTFLSMKITFANLVQDTAEKVGNVNCEFITNSLASCSQRLFSANNFAPGMVVGGVCLPRDNVVLSHMAEKYKLGYNMFSGMSEAREQQAKNLADKLLSYDRPIVIIGKSYKPGVPIAQGSSACLVAHYLGEHEHYYHDPLMDIEAPKLEEDAVYLLAHYGDDNTYDLDIPPGSIVVDPWRRFPTYYEDVLTLHYGNSRGRS